MGLEVLAVLAMWVARWVRVGPEVLAQAARPFLELNIAKIAEFY